MADINQQTETPVVQPTSPLQWTWIAQRQQSDGDAASIWKFGFVAPDGGEVRVTFHQVGDSDKQAIDQDNTAQSQLQPQQTAPVVAESSAMVPTASMPPAAPPSQQQPEEAPPPGPPGFAPAGQPNTDQTQDATFYVTFFSNRHPEFFMKWDTSLSHEDSLVVWVTITHGIVDFVRKAQPSNIILDDLANGKLKMVLRSVAMDVAAANPEYELEQTQRHHYRSFFQIKRRGLQSAFSDTVAGKSIEGDTETPSQPSPITAQQQSPSSDNGGSDTPSPEQGEVPGEKADFPSAEAIPIKQTPMKQKGVTVEIGRDYSVAVRDKQGNVVDRYRGKNPADILRWINVKGFGAGKMVIIDKEEVGVKKEAAPENQIEQYQITGNAVRVNSILPAKQAALMNYIVNAAAIHCIDQTVEFEFQTDKDMAFKCALVELAYKRTLNMC